MRFAKVIPTLYTRDLKTSIKFYTEVLGFKCVGYEQDDGWAAVGRDEVEIMLTLPNDHMKFDKPFFTGSLYIKVKDIDILWSSLKSLDCISYPLEPFEYGMKEFGIHDNNGYLIQFAEGI